LEIIDKRNISKDRELFVLIANYLIEDTALVLEVNLFKRSKENTYGKEFVWNSGKKYHGLQSGDGPELTDRILKYLKNEISKQF
jgi:hypothetical protein